MTSLRREVHPHNLAGVGHVPRRPHHISLPSGIPKSTALCRFFTVIPFSKSFRAYFFAYRFDDDSAFLFAHLYDLVEPGLLEP